MAAKTQNPTTLSRFNRFGIGRGVKSQSASPRPHSRGHSKLDGEDSDEWYIPYNGPYEAPKQPRRKKERDSWGDLVDGEEEDAVLDDRDLHHRYGGQHLRNSSHGSCDVGKEREGRTRNRTVSSASHRTVSSGAVDPSHQSVGLTRHRSTHSSGGNRQPTPSYISLDAAGGVGESPVPQRRAYSSHGTSNANRGNLASFFTFGQNKKVTPPSPNSNSNIPLSRTIAPGPSSSSISDRIKPLVRHRLDNTLTLETSGARSSARSDDYYNSYYSTLVTTPKRTSDEPQAPTARNPLPSQRKQHTNDNITPPSPSTSSPATPQKNYHHPYAYVFPSAALSPTPQSAPPASGGDGDPNGDALVVTVTEPSRFASSARGIHFPPTEQPNTHSRGALKTSISTPNLRHSSKDQPLPVLRAQLPSGKDRWLSAETWCDAILFPRPRFKIKHDGDQLGWSGRIVSPPPSPISPQFDGGLQPLSYKGEIGIQSRVLAHSRSVAELTSSSPGVGPPEPLKIIPQNAAPSVPKDTPSLRSEKPMSFAQDDLALPSPIPSLAKVLEDGQLFESQRQKWQTQAAQSFQNKRTRSFSRARSKSLTHSRARHKGSDAEKQSDLSFLGARVFLGNQAGSVRTRSNSGNGTRSTTFSSTSHSHSNSLSKTISKSSKVSHSRGHSRNESWGQSAIKMAKSTAALCGLNGDPPDPPHRDERGSALDDALKVDETKIIRLVDPAQTPVDLPCISIDGKNVVGVSPTPSANYEGVGIALSTPPPSDSGHAYESFTLPDHPYAQGTVYPQRRDAPAVAEHIHGSVKRSDYAGPHPSASKLMDVAPHINVNDVSTRHRLPPQAMLHPYAQAGFRDSYLSEEKVLPRMRLDSDVPPPAKMWAQGPSGEIEEILPSEIVYSPFSPPSGNYPGRPFGQSPRTSDTVGVGEALAFSMRHGGREAGFGTSKGQETGSSEQLDDMKVQDSVMAELHIHRKTVRHDVSHPPDHQEPPNQSDNHTRVPSPEAMVSSNSPEAAHTSPSSHEASSTSSRQISPRPLFEGVDDLDHFRDLFYRPSLSRSPSRQTATHRDPHLPWDVRPHNDRVASGLTSLARQLSEELEELHALNGSSGDPDATSKALDDLTASDFHFIFSDAQQVALPPGRTAPLQLPKKGPLQLSMNIPEDVESSRESSPLQRSPVDDDNTIRIYRVGHVDAVSTPVTTSNDHRVSGHLSLIDEPELEPERDVENRGQQTRLESLQLPSAGLTRSSYATTSTASHMSGLSDFPSPPEQFEMTPAHMSVLNSYFDDQNSSPSQLRDPSGVPPGSEAASRRMTFGGDEDIEDIANALSSHP